MNKTIFDGKWWIHAGYNWQRVALGFSIDKYGANLDFGPFWFGVEW